MGSWLETQISNFNKVSQSFATTLKIVLRSKWVGKTPQANSRDLFILANGPSLNKSLQDHGEALLGKDILCVNKFPDTEFYEKYKPKYFLFLSKEYFKPGHIQKNIENRKSIVDSFIEKTNWPCLLICPASAKSNQEFLNQFSKNNSIAIHFFNDTPVEGLQCTNAIFMRKNMGMPRPHNVVIPSLVHGINAGYKNLYLLGADHSWLSQISVDQQNNALINQKHFYDEDSSKSEHMYTNGIKPKRLHEILEKFVHSFRSYFVIEAYAKKNNVNIYNCTPTSFIDAFRRKDLNNV